MLTKSNFYEQNSSIKIIQFSDDVLISKKTVYTGPVLTGIRGAMHCLKLSSNGEYVLTKK
jgi:hypothetical protein